MSIFLLPNSINKQLFDITETEWELRFIWEN